MGNQERKLLFRFTLAHKQGKREIDIHPAGALDGLVGALTWHDEEPGLGLPGADAVTAEDTLAGLELVREERSALDRIERLIIEAAKDRGVTWDSIGGGYHASGQAAQQRYRRLGGTRTWPSPPPPGGRRAEPGADTHPAAFSVTYSVRTANDDGWREVGRTTPEPADVRHVLAGVAKQILLVDAAEWGIEPGTDVKVAVLDQTGKQIDAFTTNAQTFITKGRSTT